MKKKRRSGPSTLAELATQVDTLPVGVRKQILGLATFEAENSKFLELLSDLKLFAPVRQYIHDLHEVINEACELVDAHREDSIDIVELYREFREIGHSLETRLDYGLSDRMPFSLGAIKGAARDRIEELWDDALIVCERIRDDVRDRGYRVYYILIDG